jgi:hypothetical protein
MKSKPPGTAAQAGGVKSRISGKQRGNVANDCGHKGARDVQSAHATGRVAPPSPYGAVPGAVPYTQWRASQAQKMRGWGMAEKEIAASFGLSPEGFATWKDFPAFARALERGARAAKDGTGRGPNWVLESLLLADSLRKQRRRARRALGTRSLGRGKSLKSGAVFWSPNRRLRKIVHAAIKLGIVPVPGMISTKSKGQ